MMNLSASLPSTFLSAKSSSSSSQCARVSLPSLSFSLRRSSLSLRSHFRRSYSTSFTVNAMAELVKDKEVATSASASQSGGCGHDNVAAVSAEDKTSKKKFHSRKFLDVKTEQELFSGIKKESEAKRLPSNVAAVMGELYHNYGNAVSQSGISEADEIVLSNMATLLDCICLDVEDPYVFSPHHKALREPFDYYKFGQNYIRPLIDFGNSYVGNVTLFMEIEEKLQKGHNVVFISNHQTEADPAVIALLLETTNRRIAENMIYVAGDRVLTDPLCKPFSMGRNLICVYSKKHMNDDPELAEFKKKANIRSLKEMAMLFRGGSKLVWIAPSGGRDRPDPNTGEWYPAPFDASSVDNMRRLAEHSGAPSHIYPLALLCYDIMPPPPQVEKEIGERRVISFYGAGLSIAPEISYSNVTVGCENPEEAKNLYSQVLYDSVTEQYNVLKSAIHGKRGLEASTPTVSLSQPWN